MLVTQSREDDSLVAGKYDEFPALERTALRTKFSIFALHRSIEE